jgi:recombination protein RecR
MLPDPIQNLIFALERLPGIGPKTASRLAFYLLRAPDEVPESLAEALKDLKTRITFCQECYNITSAGRERCEICESPQRDASLICVVEEPLDVLALERTREFTGLYHVLQGAISPMEGIGPEQLKIHELLRRLRDGSVKEVILATNPNLEGEATAMYLSRLIKPLGPKVTRIARGLPIGGDLEYADEMTLTRALEGRREV